MYTDKNIDIEKSHLDRAYRYAERYSTCLKVYVGSLFIKDGKEYYGCNRSSDHNCFSNNECHKYAVTGIYESCEETREHCVATHAEKDLIDTLIAQNVDVTGGTLYVTRYPCLNCAYQIIMSGIKEVVYGGRQEISEEVKTLFHKNNIEYTWRQDCDYEFFDRRWWTEIFHEDAYKIVKDRKYPIVIPSYNRPLPNAIKGFLSNMDEEYNYPIHIFVRDSQRQSYEEAINHPYVTIHSYHDDLINNAGKVRRIIQKWLYTNGYSGAFSFDDDLLSVGYTRKGFTGKGDLKAGAAKDSNISKVLAMWQVAMEYSINKYNIMISGVSPMFVSWKADYSFPEGSILTYRGLPSQAVCINVKGLVENDLIYGSNHEVGHEDLDLVIRIIDKGFPVCVFPFLYHSAPPMSVENWKFGNMVDRFKAQQDIMRANHEDKEYVEFKDKRELPQVSVNWRRYRKIRDIKDYIFNIWRDGKLIE